MFAEDIAPRVQLNPLKLHFPTQCYAALTDKLARAYTAITVELLANSCVAARNKTLVSLGTYRHTLGCSDVKRLLKITDSLETVSIIRSDDVYRGDGNNKPLKLVQ